jgi:hypothetical protein
MAVILGWSGSEGLSGPGNTGVVQAVSARERYTWLHGLGQRMRAPQWCDPSARARAGARCYGRRWPDQSSSCSDERNLQKKTAC